MSYQRNDAHTWQKVTPGHIGNVFMSPHQDGEECPRFGVATVQWFVEIPENVPTGNAALLVMNISWGAGRGLGKVQVDARRAGQVRVVADAVTVGCIYPDKADAPLEFNVYAQVTWNDVAPANVGSMPIGPNTLTKRFVVPAGGASRPITIPDFARGVTILSDLPFDVLALDTVQVWTDSAATTTEYDEPFAVLTPIPFSGRAYSVGMQTSRRTPADFTMVFTIGL